MAFRRILFVGYGSIGQALTPVLLQQIGYLPEQLQTIAADDFGLAVANFYGVKHTCCSLTRNNFTQILEGRLEAGDCLINVSVEVSSTALIAWCQARGVHYIDTCVEPWKGGYDPKTVACVADTTNYGLREQALQLHRRGEATAVIAHGANPGLVTHFVKAGLRAMAKERGIVEDLPCPQMAEQLGIKAIHIAERDWQISSRVFEGDEFANTWHWMEDCFPQHDQFNSLHERLIERWKALPGHGAVHVASLAENEEDWVCATYMQDCITQAGHVAKHIWIEDIGWDANRKCFIDLENQPITALFKLYPWEWVMKESFGQYVPNCATRFVEPLWKSALSSKAMLPIMWEMYPDHPNLLPAYFEANRLESFAKKPFFSREGANVELRQHGEMIAYDSGPYGAEGFIYQGLCTLPQFDGKYPVIGSWVVDGHPAGMCIREDISPITTNMSNFVPHYFTAD